MSKDGKDAGAAADKTPPELRLLKQMWKIPEGKPEREKPPPDVAHDIYRVPDHKPNIPQRVANRRTSRKTNEF